LRAKNKSTAIGGTMGLQLPALIMGGLILASCGGSPDRLAEIGVELDFVWSSMVEEVGTPRATEQSQCAAMAAGAKACGGPTRYIVYSRELSDEARLRELADGFTRLEMEQNKLLNAMSDCSMLIAPPLELVAGVCRAK
jgi:hypothetical protein